MFQKKYYVNHIDIEPGVKSGQQMIGLYRGGRWKGKGNFCGWYSEEFKCSMKQLVFLLINGGFRKCRLWREKEYIITHRGTKEWRSHLIASRKMEILKSYGISDMDAQRLVIMEGKQRVNKKNLSLLGKPIWTGSFEELSNKQELFEEVVNNVHIVGLFRDKVEIILKDSDADVTGLHEL